MPTTADAAARSGTPQWFAWSVWPLLMAGCLAVTAYGFARGHPVLFFNIAYFSLVVVLLLLERHLPHETGWNESDGQLVPDIAHTLTSKGFVQAMFGFGAVIGITDAITPVDQPGYSIWPREWPLWLQVPLGIALAEFGLYWAHRAAHEWPPLWRFHAVHHSVTRLWVVNTGRFHFVDSLVSIVFGMAVLLLLGAPMEVVKWFSAFTAFAGVLTHCNVDMQCGPVSLLFNTPVLHRRHHSRDPAQGNTNYGENLMVWDLLFCTYFNPARRPPADIGISEAMPPRFLQQLAWPLQRAARIAEGADLARETRR